jgi:small subunit ribosomal protein S4e
MLDKLSGVWAPKPSSGPHKTRECIPLVILLRNRLKYALTRREVLLIAAQRLIKVDNKVRTDTRFPIGFQDVVSIPKTGENFRLLYDVKGRFNIHRISDEEAKFKLCKVVSVAIGRKTIPYLVTHDGRTVRYPDPLIKHNDTVKFSLETNTIVGHVSFDVGNLAMITGGNNLGRIGVIERREKHPGSYEIVHLKDSAGHKFATRLSNVFVIGSGVTALVTVPKSQGVKLTIMQDRQRKLNR